MCGQVLTGLRPQRPPEPLPRGMGSYSQLPPLHPSPIELDASCVHTYLAWSGWPGESQGSSEDMAGECDFSILLESGRFGNRES